MNLEKYAKLLMIISRDTPMYWPETIEMVLKSLLAKKAIKTNIVQIGCNKRHYGY